MDSVSASEDITSLEGARTRLARLDHALDSLRRELLQSEPLPPWPQLQSSLARICDQIRNASSYLVSEQAFLSSAVAYPLPKFPGIEMFGVAETLLKKKLNAEVNDWAEDSGKVGDRMLEGAEGNSRYEAMNELWNWADALNDQLIEELDFEGDTADDEDDGVKDGNDAAKVNEQLSAIGMSLEQIMRFMSTGVTPK